MIRYSERIRRFSDSHYPLIDSMGRGRVKEGESLARTAKIQWQFYIKTCRAFREFF